MYINIHNIRRRCILEILSSIFTLKKPLRHLINRDTKKFDTYPQNLLRPSLTIMKVNVHWCHDWRALVWTLHLAAAVPLQPPAISYFHLQLKTLHCSTASIASCVSKLSNIEIFRHQGCFENNIIPFATFFCTKYIGIKKCIFLPCGQVYFILNRDAMI